MHLLKKAKTGLKVFLKTDLKLKVIVALGLAGMALILISQFSAPGEVTDGQAQSAGEEGPELYAAQLEERLEQLITGIEGVGRAQVMVTLENSGEYIYAQEEKRNLDKTSEPGTGGGEGRTTQKENLEQRYILVETSYGQKQALVKTQLQPKIQGVVIVCEGADSAKVEQRIINVVTTALGVSSTRVCVEKIS